ncbi:MAG: carbon monoxide dehydrogenase subunit G [Thermoanaerobaculia bacterium]|nr:carbon monoxide dehydrogenase subunit G [Thermoanaerobaculia bacterium]
MKIQGDYHFEAPRAVVWQALLDPDILARTLPGCEKLERTGDTSFAGALTVQVGPVKGQFKGTLDLSDLVELDGYRMKLAGNGQAGFLTGDGTLALSDDGAGTLLRYDIDSQVGGKVAAVGQRLLESSAKVITKQGLEGLARELAALTANTATNAPPIVAEQPSQAAMAAQFATGLAAELVPPAKRPWVIGAGLLVTAILGFLIFRACG